MKRNLERNSNSASALAKLYYDRVGEESIGGAKGFQVTKNTCEYLLDCGFSALEIINVLNGLSFGALSYDALPDRLWQGSLIKRGAFYLHRELRLESKAPEFDIRTGIVLEYPYYCEMKIKYTVEDTLRYFRSKMKPPNIAVTSDEYDKNAIKQLFKQYSKLDYVEPLDVILCSIDNHLTLDPDCARLIDITKTNREVIASLISDMKTLEAQDRRKMVMRPVGV